MNEIKLTYYEKLILIQAMEMKIAKAEDMIKQAKKWKNQGIEVDSEKIIDVYQSVIETHNEIIEKLWKR